MCGHPRMPVVGGRQHVDLCVRHLLGRTTMGKRWVRVCALAGSAIVVIGTATAGTVVAASGATSATQAITSSKNNLLDCNMTVLERLCTDPHGKPYDGQPGRFRDPKTGAYVGHD